jgi:MoaA/NifB/PqqE/SkfB family radical SAM enzyme
MTARTDLPKILQIEPTNAFNFNCEMCLHASPEKTPPAYLPLETYEKLARDVFPSLDSLILFGWGEPLMHPDFIRMLEIARAALRPDATVKVTSNGSLLNDSIIDTIYDNELIDFLNISYDKPPGESDSFPGHHAASDRVLLNLDYALHHAMRSRIKIGIETVIMRSNIEALPELVDQFGKRGVDSILVSHVFPYYPRLEAEMLYTLMSSEAWAVFETIGDIDPQDWFGIKRNKKNTGGFPAGITQLQACALDQARTDGITLNYSLYQAVKKRAPEFKNTRMLFNQAISNARHCGLQLDLPPLFGSLQKRACPYVQSHAAVIRSDGAVVPCFKNLYPHSAFFNGRTRAYMPHVFGSLARLPFTDIWNSAQYRQFRVDMHDMNKNIAWCGDCSFSLYYCYFSEESPHDCMLNEPFCSDCPFSLNLTRCI